MLVSTRASLRVLSCSTRSSVAAFSSTTGNHVTPQPRPPLTLDPSLKLLLHDVDMSLTQKQKGTGEPVSSFARELEALENGDGEIEYYNLAEDYSIEESARRREDRKSPAARFGSDGIGTVVLSPELQHAVTTLIEGVFLLLPRIQIL